MCRYICCIEVNVYAHACEGVGEEEDMENREILRRRAGRTRAGTRWVRLAGISKHDLSSSLSFVTVPLSSFEIFFFCFCEKSSCEISARVQFDDHSIRIPVSILFARRALTSILSILGVVLLKYIVFFFWTEIFWIYRRIWKRYFLWFGGLEFFLFLIDAL